jgi:hypothetical protein
MLIDADFKGDIGGAASIQPLYWHGSILTAVIFLDVDYPIGFCPAEKIHFYFFDVGFL